MSRKSRTLKKARREGPDGLLPVSRVRGPADVAVIIPYLIGFQPVESLVLVALEGPRKRFGPVLRVDLVDDDPDGDVDLRSQQAELVVAVMARNGVGRVLVVAYSEVPGRADPVVALVREALADRGIAVEDAFRTDGGRWWSYVCGNPRCCSPEGVPYDSRTSRVAAEAVVSGLTFEADREALRAQLAPADPRTRRLVALAVRALRCDEQAADPTGDTIDTLVTEALVAPSALSPADTARLAVAVQTADGLQRLAGGITRAEAGQHYQLWRTVTTRVGDDLQPATACLAALAAWLDGRGVLASLAVDRVLELAPGHPFAELVGGLLARAVNPAAWPG